MLSTTAILRKAIDETGGAVAETFRYVRALEDEPNARHALRVLRVRLDPGAQRFVMERSGLIRCK